MLGNGTVEIVDSGSEVLDLTKPKVEAPIVEPIEGEVVPAIEGEAPDEVVPDEAVPAEVQADEDAPEEHYVGDLQVTIEVPDEVSTALGDLGIDQKAMLAHLFKKDGDFSLPEADKAKLDEKYGKYVVDSMLDSYRSKNQAVVDGHKSELKTKEETEATYGKEYSEAVGGEEGLVAMEAYLTEELDDGQIEMYNSIMESGDHKSQMFLISQLKKQMQLSDKLKNGDSDFDLVGDNTPSSNSSSSISKGYLTAAEFQTEFRSDKYRQDKAYATKVDAARVAGQKRNI